MSTWPSTLPTKQFIGTTEQDDESRLISPMDAGPSLIRNRFSAVPRPISVPITLTGAQKQIFDTFMRTTLNHATNSFTWTDPVTDEEVTYRFKTKPVWTVICPGTTATRLWSATLNLEILP